MAGISAPGAIRATHTPLPAAASVRDHEPHVGSAAVVTANSPGCPRGGQD
ncbi:hypothetical protein [Verrucosispora sioxanthis]|nr:hypothetical protein [Verrucosispora sioxanthis]